MNKPIPLMLDYSTKIVGTVQLTDEVQEFLTNLLSKSSTLSIGAILLQEGDTYKLLGLSINTTNQPSYLQAES